MALQSKTFTKEGSKGFTLKLTLTENSVDTENNTSNVTYKLVLSSTSYYFSDYSHGYNVTLNGKSVANLTHASGKNQVSLAKNSSLTVCSGTTNIAHGENGKLSMSVSYSFYTGYTDTISGTGTMALTDISRGLVYIGNGSSFDAYEVYIGNGTGWDRYIPYVGNGTDWDMCG